MIRIQTRRFGPLVVAATVDDDQEVTVAIGLTINAARHRLIGRVTR